MMGKAISKIGEYTVLYRRGGGVDFSSDTSASGRGRFAYLENMYRDYSAGGLITESIPGFRKILSLGKRINALYLQNTGDGKSFVLVHAGTSLYRFRLDERDTPGELQSIKSLCDTESCGFAFGDCFYIIDGEKITRVAPDGTASYILNGGVSAYVPTCYINGEPFEQRNLLTDLVLQKTFVAFPDDVAYESDGIKYRITNQEAKTCAVMGVGDDISGSVFIPAYMKVDNVRYEVTEIYDFAFSGNTRIASVTVADGVKRIGKFAFYCASDLSKVVLPDSVKEIDNEAFSSCTALNYLRIGAELQRLGNNVFSACTSLTEIKYALSAESFSLIENSSAADGKTISGGVKLNTTRAKIKLYGAIKSVHSVTVGGNELSFYEELDGEDVIAVVLPNIDKNLLFGATVTVKAYEHPKKSSVSGIEESNFISRLGDISCADKVICGCRKAECFDGRVFLSGNPAFPNTVFYSARDMSGASNPLYFGIFNYFDDGSGSFPVISMLAAGDSLAVFKAGDDGGGSVFYHVPEKTDSNLVPKIYPVSYVHSGIPALGASISFFDDPLFISEIGVSALDKKAINLERSIACRSHNVNPKLLSEKLSSAVMAKWCGYLFLTVGGRAYLADSASVFRHEVGSLEYEWYYLDGIGSYKNDVPVFRYSSHAKAPYKVFEKPDAAAAGEVMQKESGDGYYTLGENGEMYDVYMTEERTGGEFSPATRLLSCKEDLLFFGTQSGDICVFNNDKRGVAPERIRLSEGFSEEEYRAAWGRKIHPDFYSFASHAPRYALSTVYDDGSVPHFTKSSVKGSLTIKAECRGKGDFIAEVGTNGKGYRELARFTGGELDFSNFDFSALSFTAETRFTIPINEKEKGWIEKQISLYSREYAAPIGIDSISYRFTVKGKIKKRLI